MKLNKKTVFGQTLLKLISCISRGGISVDGRQSNREGDSWEGCKDE